MPIKHANGRIVVKVWMEEKNFHTFEGGQVIRLERKYDNFDRKYTQPIQGEVMSCDHIPSGAKIVFHHNSLHDSNRIFNYTPLSGNDIASEVQYYSIPELEAYLWKVEGEDWQPVKGFATGLRVYEPYKGILHGIPPKLIKDTLLITSGLLKGKVVMTVKAADYELIFQDKGRERKVIRIRHDDAEDIEREEVQLIRNDLTEKMNNGELLAGLTNSDAKPIHEKEIA